MAQFPSAVIAFTTKNAGDVIQPSHLNTLQDEVAAIEDGLLNGTAPVNSSRITAPASQITASTVTNLTATNSTVTNQTVTNSTITSLTATLGIFAGLRLTQSTISLSAGESTGLTLSSAVVWVIQSASGSTAVASTITGINNSGFSAGSVVVLTNSGTPTVNIAHTGSSAASAKQIATPNAQTIALQLHETVGFVYDGTLWRVLFQANG